MCTKQERNTGTTAYVELIYKYVMWLLSYDAYLTFR